MRKILFILACIFIQFSLSAQSVKFRFEIDNTDFLSIRQNAGGFNTIHQTNLQSSMFFGFNSGKNTIDDAMIFNSGAANTAYGFSTLSANTIGAFNTAIGANAMVDNQTGSTNTAIGFNALNGGSTASDNIGIGKSTLSQNTAGSFNVAIGNDAFNNTLFATRSLAIGHAAGVNDTSSVDNVYLGDGAGRGTVFATDGYDRTENVMVGSRSGYSNQTSGNVFIGFESGKNAKADNQLYITNSDTDSLNTLIYGQFDSE